MLLNYLLPLGTFLAGSAMAVNTVEVQGQDFIDSKTNNRMYIIGVEYVVDPSRSPRESG